VVLKSRLHNQANTIPSEFKARIHCCEKNITIKYYSSVTFSVTIFHDICHERYIMKTSREFAQELIKRLCYNSIMNRVAQSV
jgi:hypothetical protein